MPLLNPATPPAQTDAQKALARQFKINSTANSLKQLPRKSFDMRFNNWKSAMEAVWLDENPQDVLTALGTHAVELFQLSGAEAEALLAVVNIGTTPDVASSLTQNIQNVVALAKPVTYHQDGSVTIN